MKKPDEMTAAELLAVLGVPADCPREVAAALVRALTAGWAREGIEAVEAAAREQVTWSPIQREESRLEAIRRLGKPTGAGSRQADV